MNGGLIIVLVLLIASAVCTLTRQGYDTLLLWWAIAMMILLGVHTSIG